MRLLRATERPWDDEKIRDTGEDGCGRHEAEFCIRGVDRSVAGDVAGAGRDVLASTGEVGREQGGGEEDGCCDLGTGG